MRLFKKLIKIQGIENQIISPKCKTNMLYKRSPIEIIGNNNLVKIDEHNQIYKCHLIVNGDNNQIIIDRNVSGILKIILNGSNINNNQQENFNEETPVLRTHENQKNNSIENQGNNIESSNKIEMENEDKKEEEKKEEEVKEEKKEGEIKDKKKEEEKNEEIKEERKEAYKTGEKIRNKLMDRLNKARARSCDKKDTNDTKSQNILIKAKLLEKVLGNMKTPEDFKDNKNISTNRDLEKESIKINTYRDHSANIHVVKKKKKKNMIPFNE